jgi:hypothetical protein
LEENCSGAFNYDTSEEYAFTVLCLGDSEGGLLQQLELITLTNAGEGFGESIQKQWSI